MVYIDGVSINKNLPEELFTRQSFNPVRNKKREREQEGEWTKDKKKKFVLLRNCSIIYLFIHIRFLHQSHAETSGNLYSVK